MVKDFGDITPEIFALLNYFKVHGVRILQMSFFYDYENMYSLNHSIPHSIAYTD